MLCLQAKAAKLWVCLSFSAYVSAVQETAAVELAAWLSCLDSQGPARGRFGDGADVRQVAWRHTNTVDAVVVVVAILNLANLCPKRFLLTEVERGAFDRRDLTGWDEIGADRGEATACHVHLVFEVSLTRACASEVEVRVVCEVDNRLFVGGGFVIDPELVVFSKRVSNRGGELARVAFLHIRRDVRKLDTIAFDCRVPVPFVEAARAPVKRVLIVVGLELVLGAVQREGCICNPVSDPTCDDKDAASGVHQHRKLLSILRERQGKERGSKSRFA